MTDQEPVTLDDALSRALSAIPPERQKCIDAGDHDFPTKDPYHAKPGKVETCMVCGVRRELKLNMSVKYSFPPAREGS